MGYTSKGNTLVGQVKKAQHQTPLICPDFDIADISLGVVRNGVGSMSGQDVWVYVPDASNFATLQKAAAEGLLVTITYDEQRAAPCSMDRVVRNVEITK
jgi:hypothetical protein